MAEVKFKGTPIKLRGNFPSVGTQAPQFELVNQDLMDQTLSSFSGKKKVLAIVPSLDTSVCSNMAIKLNQAAQQHPEAIFLVVSCDLPFAQKRFCGAEGADNIQTLSVMRNRVFPETYGVLIEEGPLKGICARALLVFDENDQVLHAELVGEITEEPNYEAGLSHLHV